MKYVKVVIALAVLSIIFHFIARYRIESGTPTFISSLLDELMHNETLMDSIGGSGQFELAFNKKDLKFKDTVTYSIKIKVKERMLLRGGSVKNNFRRMEAFE